MNSTSRPLDNQVHLYCLSLPHDIPELTRCERLLSPTETERARLLKSALIRSRFIAGRGMLREILGGYLDVDPADVRIATGEQGKPFVADGAMDLRFNLSHVDDLLVLAVATGVEVGIDIERIAVDKPVHDMARLAFSRREQEELYAMPASQQIRAFYRCWVRKEACLKASGKGFSLPGNSFNISLSNDALIPRICCNDTFWHVLDIIAPHSYCTALAVESHSPDLPPPTLVFLT